jgi:transposase-like protein
MRRHYTAAQRGQLLDLVASGRSVREAAARLGISTSTASYWVRRTHAKAKQLREQDARTHAVPPSFVRLVSEQEVASLEIRVGGATLHVAPGFDADLLRAVVAVLREGAA